MYKEWNIAGSQNDGGRALVDEEKKTGQELVSWIMQRMTSESGFVQ